MKTKTWNIFITISVVVILSVIAFNAHHDDTSKKSKKRKIQRTKQVERYTESQPVVAEKPVASPKPQVAKTPEIKPQPVKEEQKSVLREAEGVYLKIDVPSKEIFKGEDVYRCSILNESPEPRIIKVNMIGSNLEYTVTIKKLLHKQYFNIKLTKQYQVYVKDVNGVEIGFLEVSNNVFEVK
jgi:hypothetical protein